MVIRNDPGGRTLGITCLNRKASASLLFGGLCIAIALAGWAHMPKPVQGLTVNRQTIDFGELQQGDTRPFVFTVSNLGSHRAESLACVPSCGCTLVDVPGAELRPGESVEISGIFNSKKARDQVAVHLTVTYFYQGELKEGFLTLKAKIRPEVYVEPATVSPRDIGTPTMLTIRSSRPFRILRAESSDPMIIVGNMKGNAITRHEVPIYIAREAQGKGVAGHVRIKTNVPTEPVIKVPVYIPSEM